MCMACLGSRGLRAQNQSSVCTAAEVAELAQRLEDLQQQVNSLRRELALVHQRFSEPSASAVSVGGTSTAASSRVASPTVQSGAGTRPNAPNSVQTLLGSTRLSGLVDGYYGYNFNQPRSRISAFRAFDGPANQFSLNLVELTLEKPPEAAKSRLGYHVALGFGQAMNVVNAAEPGGLGFAQYLKEAYLSYLAPVGRSGLQVGFGKFVTPHGAEVIETKDNWNYSRGLLFTYAVPFYHFGLRAKYVFSGKYALSGYLVNGWNNVVDNNTGKTVGVSFGWNPHKKFGLVQNYMAGPETAGTNQHWRQLSDTVATISPTNRLWFIVNYDYGRGDRLAGVSAPVSWTGWAAYLRYAFKDRNALALRYEWYSDPDGFTTGTAQQVKELTGTFEHRVAHHLTGRLEFRRDYSNQSSLLKGDLPVGAQNTLAAGMVMTFDTREPN
jgi:hypothetical protein